MDNMSYDMNLGGEKQAAQALDLYGVLSDDHWLDRLQASYLNKQQQSMVQQTAYETLLSLADFGVRWSKRSTEESTTVSLRYLEQAEAFHPPTRAFYWVRRECLKFLNKLEEAERDLKLFQSTAATTAFDYYLPGHTAGWGGDLKEAIRSYEAALRIQPDHFNSLFFLATRLHSGGRKAEAVQIWRVCLALRPNHVPTLRNRAIALGEQGNFDEALESLNKAIKLRSGSTVALAARVTIYLARGEIQKALSDLDEVIRLATKEGDASMLANAYKHRAEANNRLGRADRALEDLNAAVDLATAKIPSDHSVIFHAIRNRGMVLQALRRYDEALIDLDHAFRLNNKDGTASNQLAWFLATCPDRSYRDPSRAVELASQAVELAPRTWNNWNTLGVAQYRADDLTTAVKSLTTSLEKKGDVESPENDFFLAMAHWRLGDHDKARHWYEKAVKIMTVNKSTDEELLRFRAEAEETLGIETEAQTPKKSDGQSPEAVISSEKTLQDVPPTNSDLP